MNWRWPTTMRPTASATRRLLPMLFMGLLCVCPLAGQTQTRLYRLDDTGTRLLGARALLEWSDLRPGASLRTGPSRELTARVLVDLQLLTSAWQGKQARIYVRLEPLPNESLLVQWPAAEPFREGQVRPGERVLVFAGLIPGPRLQLRWPLHLRTTGPWSGSIRQLSFVFELEPS